MNEERTFIEAQIAAVQPIIKQLKIMQMAWREGGEMFQEKLDAVTKELGGYLAVEASLRNQLSAIQIETDPSIPTGHP